ncbi:odorant receptor 49b-like [Ochlerotatus camptorhynchus]|uniref:odorant receptor 49b-like n=1 Tax=Ochlerotatus camptorhynchus TaxID=644619 RepID=UPI0031D3C96A
MQSIIKLLQIFGFWTQPYQGHNLRKPLFHMSMYIIWLLGPGIIHIVRQRSNFASITRAAIESIGFINGILLSTNMIIHRSLLERTYGAVRSVMQSIASDLSKDVQSTVKLLETSTDLFFKIYIGFQAIVGIAYTLSNPVLTLIDYLQIGVLPPLQGIFEADFLFFEFSSTVWLWLLLIVICGLTIFDLIIVLVSVNSLNWSLIHHVTGLFKLVCIKISRLDELSDERARHKELVDIVRLQEITYRSARAMEEALNVYLLIQFSTCVIAICMTMITLTMARDDRDLLIKMSLMLAFVLFHIFVYSMLGTELMFASTSVADAVYCTNWYQWSVSEQRNILFMLRRSQLMTSLTTGKFFELSRSTFGMTLQAAMSHFTVVRQIYDSQ